MPGNDRFHTWNVVGTSEKSSGNNQQRVSTYEVHIETTDESCRPDVHDFPQNTGICSALDLYPIRRIIYRWKISRARKNKVSVEDDLVTWNLIILKIFLSEKCFDNLTCKNVPKPKVGLVPWFTL